MISAFSPLYEFGVRFRNRLYDNGTIKSHQLVGPVISVGNLSVGGSGKTPFVIALGKLLLDCGLAIDVLSRGYRRQTSGVAIVDPSGESRTFGDEPLLISRKLDVPVVIGSNRYQAGLKAEAHFGPQVHLLDDGFQHRKLRRQFDIVLLSEDDLAGKLLPRGRLREPLSSLVRADAIVITGKFARDVLATSGKPIWQIERHLSLQDVASKPLAFCGIAKPKNFFYDLRQNGVNPVAEVAFRDHQRYTRFDVEKLLQKAADSGADGFVTTEKDAVNLSGLASQLSPLAVADLSVHWNNAKEDIDSMFSVIKARTPAFENLRGT